MVAGKMRVAMGLSKSPAHSKAEASPKPPSPSPSSAKVTQKAVFSRSFGVYFPRSSAQVQPKPPDASELIRIVEELRERESRLKTELLEHKLLRESVAIVPVLENEISARDTELERASKRIESLEAENERLRSEMEDLKKKVDGERRESDEKAKALEAEIEELKKTAASDRSRAELLAENEELSSSQRFHGLMEVSGRSSLIKNLKKGVKCTDVGTNSENQKLLEVPDSKREEESSESERPRHSRCNSEELAESSYSVLSNVRSRAPRVPKPPPRPSSSSSSSNGAFAASSEIKTPTEQAIPPPPPPPPLSKAAPPPPPPPPRGLKPMPAKVRRVPEVVEFYHSLMRRDSRRESGVSDVSSTANARDMIGEIENRSSYLLAVSSGYGVLSFERNYAITTGFLYVTDY